MPILFTPRTPALVFITVLLLWLYPFQNTKAQRTIDHIGVVNDTLLRIQSLPVYEESLQLYHEMKLTAELREFQQLHRKKWWYYLPTIGFQFGLPSIQFGTGTLAEIDRDRTVLKAKLQSIELKANLAFQEDLTELRRLYLGMKAELALLTDHAASYTYQMKIMQIRREEFADPKAGMKPIEHLQAELQGNEALIHYWNQHKAIYLKLLDIERLARYRPRLRPLSTTIQNEGREGER